MDTVQHKRMMISLTIMPFLTLIYGMCYAETSTFIFEGYSHFPYSTCIWQPIDDPVSMLGCSRSCSARTGCLGFAYKADIPGCVLIDPLSTDLCNVLQVNMSGTIENWVTVIRQSGIESCVEYLVPSVPDSHITASSTYEGFPEYNVEPHQARLNNNRSLTDDGRLTVGGWGISTDDDTDRWIQVVFKKEKVVHGIATQGAWNDPDNPKNIYDQRVTKYEILHSINCVNWTTVTDISGQKMEFVGNTVVNKGNIIQTNLLDIPVVANCVRLHILEWDTAMTNLKMFAVLRLDFLGCDYN